MSILLVHGAFADHHAFDLARPLLEARGFTTLAPDLPGHGADATPLAAISLDAYVDAIAKLVLAEKEPVHLVGHSMAGMVVSQVAERLGRAKIASLTYVAAYVPLNGQNLQGLAETDEASLVGKNMQFAPDWSTVTIAKDAVVEAICADCPPPVQAMIVASQKPEPLAPFQGKVTLGASFAAVPKAYLRTTLDRAVTPALQERMLAATPMKTESLATGHLPFVAKPDAFVDALLRLVAS
jgi:pimeloyl-ACP methyl ester carboxylesterase